jgi:hypothetical protein
MGAAAARRRALAEGLRAALTNLEEAQRRGAVAAERVSRRYGLPRLFAQVRELYADLENENARP